MGAAEAYLRGWWEADDLTRLLRIFARNRAVLSDLEGGSARVTSPLRRLQHAWRRNTRSGSRRNIAEHYDLGNDFFALFLDDTMTYSCGIYPEPESTLREASIEKLDRACRVLGLRPDHRLLEIGTGWGSLAIHAASRYGCRVTTTTISAEQHELASRRVREAGMEDRVEILRRDYRELRGTYDRLVSIEMIEAVGHEFLDAYFAACSRLLADDGAMLLQAIVMPDEGYEAYLGRVDAIQHFVFPGSCLPSRGSIRSSVDRVSDFRVAGVAEIGDHYVPTLRTWRERFHARLDDVRRLGYPERFIRLWDYYLSYCEAGFAERYVGDVQMLLAKPAFPAAAAADGQAA
jgi:cyclopropane-fatty-acyl-phospholipid synthase